ncbi:MAG: hypothetical protein SGI99_08000 [Pseudomonadota bacterium]|nr:hypothetical protein [Pseudomonadota bacterium]
MTRISSRYTFFYKKVFPVFWFGFIAFFVAWTLPSSVVEQRVVMFVSPVLMGVIGFIVFKKFVWDLADEVTDGGEFLLVRKGGEEARVRLSCIMNVSASSNVNPPRIVLRLVKPGRFGTEIAFSPTIEFSLNPFAKGRIAEDLIVRVDRARSERQR